MEPICLSTGISGAGGRSTRHREGGRSVKYEYMKEFSLEGRVAAITGAAGELCGVMSAALAGLGVRVAMLDIDLDRAQSKADAIRADGGDVLAVQCDVLDRASLEQACDAIRTRWTEPDILINGAGGNHPAGSTDRDFFESPDLEDDDVKSFFNLSLEGFNRVLDLNFIGTFLPTQVFGRAMAQAQSGSILNISSMNYYNPLTRIPAYAAAKAAVSNLTKWLAVHFAHVGIRVNAIAPGFLMTEQLKFLHIDQETGEYTPRAQSVLAHTPAGRYGKPEELVGTIIWLLSDASRFVTGVTVAIDGGFSSYSI
jgi:NAD(P)-dependent dehydrogenase (short-subunit alcohol dehydrogenase family)